MNCRSLSLVIIICSLWWTIRGQNVKNRSKRTLVFPEGGSKLLAICGFGVPVDYLKPETVIVGTVFKANYVFPTNASQLTDPFVTYARKKRSSNRWDLYKLFIRAMEIRGFDGKSCLLRTICEIARAPLVKNFGLFHELIHMFFTPSSTNEKIDHNADNEYFAAQIFGKKKRNCEEIFNKCSESFLDLFTLSEDAVTL